MDKVLYPSNKICPKCGKSGYVNYIGQSDKYMAKCYNCGFYFEKGAFPVATLDKTPPTNADRLRAMSDEKLAEFLAKYRCVHKAPHCMEANCAQCWLDWLRQEASE